MKVVANSALESGPHQPERAEQGCCGEILTLAFGNGGELQLVDGDRDHAAERLESIAIRFVIRITEFGGRRARVEAQRKVDHRGRIARIERSRHDGLVYREHRGIDANPERQRGNRHEGEPAGAKQHPRRVAQVLPQRFEQVRDLSHLTALSERYVRERATVPTQ